MGKWQVVRIPLLIACLLIAYWIFCALAYGQTKFPLPPQEGRTAIGCTTLQLNDGRVRAAGWANYDDEHLEAVRGEHFSHETEKDYPHRGWVALISERSGKKADFEAARDCVEWLRVVKANTKENQKQ